MKREKRIIKTPQRYLAFTNLYSAGGGGRKSSTTRSVLLKKNPVRARQLINDRKMKINQADELEASSFAAAAAASDKEKAVVLVETMESTPTPNPPAVRKWVRLMLLKNDADYKKLVGLACKIYWPLDDAWYSGRLKEFNAETGYHHVLYDDGDEEDLILSEEMIDFWMSWEELQQLRFLSSYTIIRSEEEEEDDDESQELGPGDITWAKLITSDGDGDGAIWPALVLDEELMGGYNKTTLPMGKDIGHNSLVQFFGTYHLARVNKIEITTPFMKGIVSGFHHKSNKPVFLRAVEEARLYLCQQKLPEEMQLMQYDFMLEPQVSHDQKTSDQDHHHHHHHHEEESVASN